MPGCPDVWTDAKRAPGLREILVSTSNEWIYVMIKCNVGVGVYDRTLPLMAGLFNIEGVDATWDIAPLERIFARAFDEQAFAIAEQASAPMWGFRFFRPDPSGIRRFSFELTAVSARLRILKVDG